MTQAQQNIQTTVVKNEVNSLLGKAKEFARKGKINEMNTNIKRAEIWANDINLNIAENVRLIRALAALLGHYQQSAPKAAAVVAA